MQNSSKSADAETKRIQELQSQIEIQRAAISDLQSQLSSHPSYRPIDQQDTTSFFAPMSAHPAAPLPQEDEGLSHDARIQLLESTLEKLRSQKLRDQATLDLLLQPLLPSYATPSENNLAGQNQVLFDLSGESVTDEQQGPLNNPAELNQDNTDENKIRTPGCIRHSERQPPPLMPRNGRIRTPWSQTPLRPLLDEATEKENDGAPNVARSLFSM